MAVGILLLVHLVLLPVYIVDGGEGYSTPTVHIDPPVVDSTTGIGGTFVFNEIVTGSISGTTARVKEWNGVTDVMEVGVISGSFTEGEVLTGSESGAKYTVGSINTDDIVDPYADNDNIEIEADTIIDFSQSNPFGMP